MSASVTSSTTTMASDNVLPPQLQRFVHGAQCLYDSGQYSDLIITCKGTEWKVHRFVLAAQSDFFQTACTGPFKEAVNQVIALDEDDPRFVDGLIRYFYNFGSVFDIPTDGLSRTELSIGTHEMAQKYCVEPLRLQALKELEECVEDEWHASNILEIAGNAYSQLLSDQVRDVIVCAVGRHIYSMSDTTEGRQQLAHAVRKTPSFGADLALAVTLSSSGLKKYGQRDFLCSDCQNSFPATLNATQEIYFACPECGECKHEAAWMEHEL